MTSLYETKANGEEIHRISIRALYDLKRQAAPMIKELSKADIDRFVNSGVVSREQADGAIAALETSKGYGLPYLRKALDKARIFELPLSWMINLTAYIGERDYPDNIDQVYFEPTVDLKGKWINLLPFDSILLISAQAAAKSMEEDKSFPAPVGFVVTDENVWIVHYVLEEDRFGAMPLFLGHCPYTDEVPEELEKEYSKERASEYMLLMILLTAVHCESNNRTRVKSSLKASMFEKKAAKARRLSQIPHEYYVISSKETYSGGNAASAFAGAGYCFDVMGWSTHRIIRGSLPMSEAYEKRLRKDADRTIIKCRADITPEIGKVLADRKIVYNEGDWISVRPYSVPSHQRNKDKPYVPAIRVVQ